MEIKKRIHNWYFVLSLSMVTDVYKEYRKISCILHRINIQQWLDMNVMGVVQKVGDRANNLVKFLYEGLKEKVYEKEEVTYIENCRRILDLRSHVKKIKEHGTVKISGHS